MAHAALSGAEICRRVRETGFPAGEYVVCGSAAMAARGLRDAGDIDLTVSSVLYERLARAGWQERRFPTVGRERVLFSFPFDVSTGWGVGTYQPTLAQLIADSEAIDGVSFVSLTALACWKRTCGRPKDLADLQLIEQALASQRGC